MHIDVIRVPFGTMCLLAFMGLLCSPLCAAEPGAKHDLSQRRQAGEVSNFELLTELRMQFHPDGQARPDPPSLIRMRDTGKVTILKVKDGVPAAVRIAFDADCSVTMERPGEQPAQWPGTFAGQTITAHLDEQGKLRHDYRGDAPDELVRESLMWMVDDDAFARPAGPVAIGDAWPSDKPGIRRFYELPADAECEGTMRLLGVKEVAGRKIGQTAVEVRFTKTVAEEVTGRYVIDGTIDYDLATGQGIRGSIRGTMTFTIRQTDPPDPDRRTGRSTTNAIWLLRYSPAPRAEEGM